MKKVIFLAFTCLITGIPFRSSGQPGLSEMKVVKEDIWTFYGPMYNLILVIAGICGLVGAARIYVNWQTGRERITTDVIGWFGGGIFISVLGIIVKGLFS